MIRHVIRHEARTLAADRTLWLFVALFGLVFGYAVVNGTEWMLFERNTLADAAFEGHTRSVALEHDMRAAESGSVPGLDPRAPLIVGGARGARFAALPPGPLAALSVGQSDLRPYYFDLSLNTNEYALLKNGEQENPLNLMVGHFDVAFVLVYLMPLLILALSYNMLSAEKEEGTLALTLSQPVTLGSVLGGKLAFRALVVVGVAVVLSLGGALVTTGGGVSAGRLALWVAVGLVYALFWFAVAGTVNALGRGSAWNATVLMGAWIALVVVIPSFANIAAGLFFPLPSRVEMITAERDATRAALDRRSELLARFYEDHRELAGAGVGMDSTNVDALSWAATEEVYRLGREVAERYDRELARQHRMVDAFKYLSPAILTQEALNDIAGTGDARYASFRAQVDAFLEEWKAFFAPRIVAGKRINADELPGLPVFEYVEESGRSLLLRVLGPLAVLVASTLLAAVPAWRGIHRYPVVG